MVQDLPRHEKKPGLLPSRFLSRTIRALELELFGYFADTTFFLTRLELEGKAFHTSTQHHYVMSESAGDCGQGSTPKRVDSLTFRPREQIETSLPDQVMVNGIDSRTIVLVASL